MSIPSNPSQLKEEIYSILIDRGFGPSSPAAHNIWLNKVEFRGWSAVAQVAEKGDTLTWLYDTAEDYLAEGWTENRRTAQLFINQFAG